MFGKKFVFNVILFYVSYLSIPIVKDIMQIPTAVLDFVVLGVVVIFSINSFKNKITSWAVLYLSILALYVFAGKRLPTLGIADYDSWRLFVIESAKILTSLAIFSFWYKERNSLPWEFFMRFTLILFTISFLYILPFAQLDVDLMRKNEAYGINHTFGIPSYTLTHAYVFLVPPIIYAFMLNKGRTKWTYLFVLILLLALILKTYVTTNIILSLVTVVLALFYRENNVKMIGATVILISFFFLLLFTGTLDGMLNGMVGYFTGTGVESKMIEFRSMLLGVEMEDNGVIQDRNELHGMSWDVFKNNILFGGEGNGGHSYIVDRLAGLGVVGTMPFIIMIICSFIIMYRVLITRKSRFFLFVFGLMVFMMMYNKGLFGEEAWMIMWGVGPMYLYTIQKKELSVIKNNN